MSTLLPTPTMPPRLSHSQVMTYSTCGEQYRLERRHQLGGSISWALVGGKAFHVWTEAYDTGIPVEPKDFVKFLNDQVREDLASKRNPAKTEAEIKPTGRKTKAEPNGRDRTWWEREGVVMCEKFVEWRNSPDNELMPKESVAGEDYLVEFEVKGTLGTIDTLGFIDRLILDSPHGEPVVVDYKTGKEPGTLLQLATYAVIASEMLGIKITKGAFYLAEKGELSAIHDLGFMDRAYVESLYTQAERGIRNGVFLPNPNAFCGSCAVKKFCGLYGGRAPLGVPILEEVIA